MASNPAGLLGRCALIIGLGLAAGAVDARLRPVPLHLSAPVAPVPVAPAPIGAPASAPGATPETPAQRPTPAPAQPDRAGPGEATRVAPAPGSPNPPAFVPTPPEKLKPGEVTLADALDRHSFMGAVFLDARTQEEYEAGHVQGAHLAPMSAFRGGTPPAALEGLAKDHPIVVYCGGGDDCHASEEVALLLMGGGFTNVVVLRDGWKGWAALGYPASTGAQP